MKINGTAKVTVLGKEATISETTGKTGYKLAIMQGSEAGSIGCTEDVYNSVEVLNRYDAVLTYDDKYNYARLTSVDVKSKTPAFK